MDSYREVHSLDYALCVVVSLLNRVFFGHCKGWNVNNGLNIEICKTEVRGGIHHVNVCIRPVGWRDDEYIWVRSVKIRDDWSFKGTVCHSNLMDYLGSRWFSFNVEYPMLSVEAIGTTEEDFLKKVCPEWT